MPLETTIVDLWRLVHDYEIPTIVMLNKDIQKGVCCYIFAYCLNRKGLLRILQIFVLPSKKYKKVYINVFTGMAFNN